MGYGEIYLNWLCKVRGEAETREYEDICAYLTAKNLLSFRELVATKLASVKREVGLEHAVLSGRSAGVYGDTQNVWNACGRETNILARRFETGRDA